MIDEPVVISGRVVVPGSAEGEILFSDVGLSFWGGVDALTGEVIDRHHPLSGQSLAGRILAIPTSRGSCSGSGVVLELLLNDKGPAAIVLERTEAIITLGVIVAEELFGRSIPVLCVGVETFASLREAGTARINADSRSSEGKAIRLSEEDKAILSSARGEAAAVAMRIVLRMAEIEEAEDLIDITRAHIDGCIYTGPGGLAFAEKLKDLGGRVQVPTTLNAISVDQRSWRTQGIPPVFGEPASRLADAYVAMGAEPTFTCAPYLLDDRPERDEQIVWAESNAVVFANSVLGARTMKYPDYLDICVALTGRAPKAGCHIDAARLPALRIGLPHLETIDDSLYPLLGYLVGTLAPDAVPILEGLAEHAPSFDDLKAFGAAFATTSAAPMFHIAGVTPEAVTHSGYPGLALPVTEITPQQLRQAWAELNGAAPGSVQLVSLGNPHFSADEIGKLAALCHGQTKHPDVSLIVTCGRHQLERARTAGDVAPLEAFGVVFVTDTCWCMITEPLIPAVTKVIMTNSGKYAHYGPGLSGRVMRFGSLSACVEAAVTGADCDNSPAWLAGNSDI